MTGHLCRWGEQCAEFTKWHSVMKRRVRVYDNGGKTIDRYSVAISRQRRGQKVYDIYGMSEDALSPQGFNQFCVSVGDMRAMDFTESKRVQVQDLPREVITAIEHRL